MRARRACPDWDAHNSLIGMLITVLKSIKLDWNPNVTEGGTATGGRLP